MGHSLRWKENRARVDKLKSEPCMDCGKTWPPYCMDYDHRPGEVRVTGVSQLLGRPWEEVQTEIAKCDLVCACCHRIRTNTRSGPGSARPKLGINPKAPIPKTTKEERIASFKEAHVRSKERYRAGAKAARDRERKQRVIDFDLQKAK